MLGSPTDVLNQFYAMDARVVFSAEPYCWPDQSLADQFPVTESRYKYLNSGGYFVTIYSIILPHMRIVLIVAFYSMLSCNQIVISVLKMFRLY